MPEAVGVVVAFWVVCHVVCGYMPLPTPPPLCLSWLLVVVINGRVGLGTVGFNGARGG